MERAGRETAGKYPTGITRFVTASPAAVNDSGPFDLRPWALPQKAFALEAIALPGIWRAFLALHSGIEL
ncbi:hypothetical protein OPV22_027785 [Ensete ventricosum]|uniref:Uncharacterized protein n=1 Tax=Ensete ventricosum TaxID=4639 RepID=A0AAV8PWC9_ENSVE|nr:hypothetical protein OPV22_027785 [Ensete ventricosum]